MKDNKNDIIEVCNLYVNDWHLTTMLLPYINKTISEKEKVLTILESGIKNNIEQLLSKMNLHPTKQNKILEIDWESNPTCKFSKLTEQIKDLSNDVQAINIIVKGIEDFKVVANKNIQKLLEGIKGKKITIINCYDITKYKDIDSILDKHEYVLNTGGIKKIDDVFLNYKKKDFNNKETKIV